MLKKLLLISCLLLLSNCASKQSYIGASSTAAVAGTTCWQYVSDNPAVGIRDPDNVEAADNAIKRKPDGVSEGSAKDIPSC